MSILNAIRIAMLTLFVATGSTVIAQQDAGNTFSQKASFDDNMKLELPVTDRLPYSYEIDITGIGFKDAQIAGQYFRGVSDNLVHFEANEEGTMVTMRLQYQNTGQNQWTREDWNSYLSKKQERFQDYLLRMND